MLGHFKVLLRKIDENLIKDRQQSIGAVLRCFLLVVSSVNIHDIYLGTQLRTLYIDMNIVEIYARSDM